MKEKKPHGYWHIKENCAKEALNYYRRVDFMRYSKSAYNIARRNKWLDDICGHMEQQGSLEKRYIYKATFPDGAVYIGLTCNYKKRFNEHITEEKSSVYKYMVETNTEPLLELMSNILYSKEDASELEVFIVEEYKKYEYNVLNKVKAGGLGGGDTRKWTLDILTAEALKYETKRQFELNNRRAYQAATSYKVIDEICSHMISSRKPSGYWTKERCAEEALKYTSQRQFRENSSAAYDAVFRYGWIKELCSHYVWKHNRVKDNNSGKIYNTVVELSKDLNISYDYLINILNNKRHSSKINIEYIE